MDLWANSAGVIRQSAPVCRGRCSATRCGSGTGAGSHRGGGGAVIEDDRLWPAVQSNDASQPARKLRASPRRGTGDERQALACAVVNDGALGDGLEIDPERSLIRVSPIRLEATGSRSRSPQAGSQPARQGPSVSAGCRDGNGETDTASGSARKVMVPSTWTSNELRYRSNHALVAGEALRQPVQQGPAMPPAADVSLSSRRPVDGGASRRLRPRQAGEAGAPAHSVRAGIASPFMTMVSRPSRAWSPIRVS